MIPLRTDSRLRATPWMNWGIIALNIAAYMVQTHVPSMTRYLALRPDDPTLLNFFSYSILHDGVMHIASNMLFLYIFGNNVNDKMGSLGYLGFYLAGVVFSGVGQVAIGGGGSRPIIGASGGVAAVTGAYMVLSPRAHVTLLYYFLFIGVIEIPSAWFIGFFFVQEFFLNFSGMDAGVAHMAHLAGAGFGFVVTFGLLSANLLPRDHFDVVALAKQWNRRRQFRDITAKGYDPFAYSPSARIRAEHRLPAPADPKQEQIQDIRARIADAMSQRDHAKAAELYVQLRGVDPEQVLARQTQLDVANQLASQQNYDQAAAAYELFLRHYKNFEQIEQIELMLGLIYARYLSRYDRAKEYLLRAMARLHGDRELGLARAELQRIEPLLAPP
jgi:membrane associated rhomboid family serine protease